LAVKLKTLNPRSRGDRCCATDITARLDAGAAQALTSDLEILAHPVRLQLLDLLTQSEGRVCVCDLEAAVPVKQPTVSHHLRLLRESGLVDCEKQGLWCYYFVNRTVLSALRRRIETRLASLSANS
jgi:ArsR family transcriptional regulator